MNDALDTTPARTEALSAADQVRKLMPREERLGGQTFKYVKLSDVLEILEGPEDDGACTTCRGSGYDPLMEKTCDCA